MWHTHQNFESWARSRWPSLQGQLMNKIQAMASSFSDWNRKSFGNLFYELNRLQHRINGIQSSPNYHHSQFLQQLERSLLGQLALKNQQAEIFWAQRARINWLSQGDKNTRFFHVAAKIHHRRNRVVYLQTKDGLEFQDHQQISNHYLNYFKKVFQAGENPTNHLSLSLPNSLESYISQAENDSLNIPPSSQEVHRALFSINLTKAPGLDGFIRKFSKNSGT